MFPLRKNQSEQTLKPSEQTPATTEQHFNYTAILFNILIYCDFSPPKLVYFSYWNILNNSKQSKPWKIKSYTSIQSQHFFPAFFTSTQNIIVSLDIDY